MADTTAAADRVAAYLADVRMQAEDHHLVPAADALALLAAVEAATAIHEPVSYATGLACAGCQDPSGMRVDWPCETYEAITSALLGKDSADGD